MATTQVVFIYSTVAPYSPAACVVTDDNDHPGVPVLQRPECNPIGYTFNGAPCAALSMPIAQYQKLTPPHEKDPILLTAIGVAVGVPYVPPQPTLGNSSGSAAL